MVVDESGGVEVEASTVEEFLRLLKAREGEGGSEAARDRLSRAVFVARVREEEGSRYAFPKVTRQVVAAFASGGYVVCCRRIVSSAVELPEMEGNLEQRQREAHEEFWSEIGRGLHEANLGVPLYEGFLRRAAASSTSE